MTKVDSNARGITSPTFLPKKFSLKNGPITAEHKPPKSHVSGDQGPLRPPIGRCLKLNDQDDERHKMGLSNLIKS